MMSFHRRFSSFRWKLAASYVAVTLLMVLVIEGIVILSASGLNAWIGDAWVSRSALDRAGQLAELAADPLAADSPTRLAQVLNQPMGLTIKIIKDTTEKGDLGGESPFVIGTQKRIILGSEESHWDSEARVVIGTQGRVIASNQPERYPPGSPFAEPGFPEAERLVAETLADGVTTSHLAEEPSLFAVAMPIISEEERLGILYYRQPLSDPSGLSLSYLGSQLLTTTRMLLPFIIPLGLIFGLVSATFFTRRLGRLTKASSSLESGDLGSRVHDSSGDEIGQLARQFNAMAGQLEAETARLRELSDRNAQLARQAQRLAALEERHRLARDLHDGVKQHLFSMNLAIAAALNLLDSDPEAARSRLLEAKELSHQAQAEMLALLDELRPAGLDERGLVTALTDYLAGYERREGIEVHWQMIGDLVALPLTHEQALFRIAQEALTNVARHAQASRVTVELHATPETVKLRVADNGMGFDPSATQTGAAMGLQSMQERLARLGGTLTVDTIPGAGTQLLTCLPRPAHTEQDRSNA